MLSDVRIVTHGAGRLPKSVQVDGHELGNSCHKATVDYSAGAIPKVTLVFHGRDVQIFHEADGQDGPGTN